MRPLITIVLVLRSVMLKIIWMRTERKVMKSTDHVKISAGLENCTGIGDICEFMLVELGWSG